MDMKKCVIVGAGICDIQRLKKKMAVLDDDLCIAADGGLAYLMQIGRMPDLVLGDMDSLRDEEMLRALDGEVCVRRLPVEKDDTDMLAAIKEGLEAGYRQFEIYGALGGRIDHTFANVQCLLYLQNRGARGIIVGDDAALMLVRDGSIAFEAEDAEKGRRVSVFAYGGDAYGVSECGLKYLLDHVTVKQEFPVGVSNEFMGEAARIEVESGMLLVCVEEL